MIDAHCHVDMYKNPAKILENCEINAITVLAMTNLPSHFEMGYPHVRPFKRIRLSLGLHPLYADRHKQELPQFIKSLQKTSYIGEVGLDFSREGYATRDLQIESFQRVLELVADKHKILSIHSRRAEKEVLAMLIGHRIENAIFHWYSGPLSLIDRIASAGYYFSVNTAMVNSENGKKIIGKIPLDKLLTETDGPFIELNGKPVVPSDIQMLHSELALLKGMLSEEINVIVDSNFQELIRRLKT
jgi:TatD DNase family protein